MGSCCRPPLLGGLRADGPGDLEADRAPGRESCGLTRVDIDEAPTTRAESGRPATIHRAVVTSPRTRRPGSRERPAEACGVDPRRSASRLGARRTRRSGGDVRRPVRGTLRHAAAATVPGIPEEESVVRPGRRQTGARRTAPRSQRRVRHRGDVVTVLARAVREVEAAAERGRVTPAVRTKFQAVALLLRDEWAR